MQWRWNNFKGKKYHINAGLAVAWLARAVDANLRLEDDEFETYRRSNSAVLIMGHGARLERDVLSRRFRPFWIGGFKLWGRLYYVLGSFCSVDAL